MSHNQNPATLVLPEDAPGETAGIGRGDYRGVRPKLAANGAAVIRLRTVAVT